jgi:hypothetical protein
MVRTVQKPPQTTETAWRKGTALAKRSWAHSFIQVRADAVRMAERNLIMLRSVIREVSGCQKKNGKSVLCEGCQMSVIQALKETTPVGTTKKGGK